MLTQGLSKGRRLHLKNDFQEIIQGGKRIQGPCLVLWYKPASSGEQTQRMGLVVSKKLGSAVVRNRAKRLLREAFRLNREKLASGVDYIFSPRCSENWTTLTQAQVHLQCVCHQAGLWQD
jgi:ribonuclease P protein component